MTAFIQKWLYVATRACTSEHPHPLAPPTHPDFAPVSLPHCLLSSSDTTCVLVLVLAFVPNQQKQLRIALRGIEAEKREAARAASRGGALVYWAVRMAVAVLAAMVLLFVSAYERELSKSLFFLFGGGRLPAWVADRICSLLGLVDPLSAPVVVLTFFEVGLIFATVYCFLLCCWCCCFCWCCCALLVLVVRCCYWGCSRSPL